MNYGYDSNNQLHTKMKAIYYTKDSRLGRLLFDLYHIPKGESGIVA